MMLTEHDLTMLRCERAGRLACRKYLNFRRYARRMRRIYPGWGHGKNNRL